MIRETGQVVAVNGDLITVATRLKQGCDGCKQQNHCGAGILSKAFPERERNIQLTMQNPPEPGAMVEVMLPERVMLKFSVLLYLLPLVVLFTAASVTQWFLPEPEWPSIIAGAGAMYLSFRWLRRWLSSRDIRVTELVEVRMTEPAN